MQAIGFDNDKYLRMQSEKIRERIGQFGGKLYLEFGGKLFDDYHASRVLPGFAPDSKVRMLMEMRDEAEIIIAISADDIERNKRRGDLGITYDDDTLRLIDAFQGCTSAASSSRTTAASPRRKSSSAGSRRSASACTGTTSSRTTRPTSRASSATTASAATTTSRRRAASSL